MEDKGLVVRERDPNDKRAFRVFLTDRGRAFEAVAERVLGELEKMVRSALPGAGRAQLESRLRILMELRDKEED